MNEFGKYQYSNYLGVLFECNSKTVAFQIGDKTKPSLTNMIDLTEVIMQEKASPLIQLSPLHFSIGVRPTKLPVSDKGIDKIRRILLK